MAILKKIRVAQYQRDSMRVVLEVDDLSEYSAFVLPNPYRLIIDIHGRKAAPDGGCERYGSGFAGRNGERSSRSIRRWATLPGLWRSPVRCSCDSDASSRGPALPNRRKSHSNTRNRRESWRSMPQPQIPRDSAGVGC